MFCIFISPAYDSFTGTSIAAPFVTGTCSILMEWGITNKNDLFLYGQRMKAFLRLAARRKNNLSYPDEEWGFGSLCISNTLNMLELFRPVSEVSIKNMSEEELFTVEDAVYSDDYSTMIAQYNSETIRILQEYDFIKMCRKLTGDFVILYVETKKMRILTNDEISRMVLQNPFLLGLMDKSALEASGVLAVQNQPFLNLKGSGVLIGIVDTGINYTLEEFIYEDNTTKIVSIWDQTIIGSPPKGQCYGTEFTREDINRALQNEVPFDIVPSNDEIGHGTKLASICAGRENIRKNFIGVAPDAELVVVKLKQAKRALKEYNFIDDSVPAFSSADLMLGIEYLYEKSLELNRPLAICIGLGTNEGTHNGFSILEQYISNIAVKNGVAISICNGNEANTENHTLINLSEVEKEESIEIRVGENTRGFSLTLVTYPVDRIGVNVISPSGESTGRIPPRSNYNTEIFLPLSDTRIQVQYISNNFEFSGSLVVITFKKPSPGIWTVNVYGENILLGEIHGWLPISNFLGPETYFLNPDPFYTVTVPSTANLVISVGGYNSFDNSFFVDSGRGPTRLGIIKPILAAPAVNISCIGINGDLETITGTSAATAIVSGCAALLLEWGIVKGNSPSMNSTVIIGYLASGTKRISNQVYPNNLLGYGVLNILGTFENI